VVHHRLHGAITRRHIRASEYIQVQESGRALDIPKTEAGEEEETMQG